jgi:hypothetical protein
VIVLAILLLIVAAAVVALMVAVGFTGSVRFGTFAGHVVTQPFWVFLLGAVTMLIALLALSLLRRGTKRKVERRREIKRLRRVEQESQTPGTTAAGPRTGYGVDDRRLEDDPPDRTLVRDRGSDADLGSAPGGLAGTGEQDPRGRSRQQPS